MYLISACLCGENCKYSGGNNFDERAYKIFKEGKGVLVCPEQLGGLPTPRVPSEISGGTGLDVLEGKARVITKDGRDVTEEFIRGAEETLAIAKKYKCHTAIFKAKSPSCGINNIYDGSFSKKLIAGNGVTAEVLVKNGIKVFSEKEI